MLAVITSEGGGGAGRVGSRTTAPASVPTPKAPKPPIFHATPIIAGRISTTPNVGTAPAPVMVPSNNPTAGTIQASSLGLALPTSPLFSNIVYPVIAAIIGALVLIYALKVKA